MSKQRLQSIEDNQCNETTGHRRQPMRLFHPSLVQQTSGFAVVIDWTTCDLEVAASQK